MAFIFQQKVNKIAWQYMEIGRAWAWDFFWLYSGSLSVISTPKQTKQVPHKKVPNPNNIKIYHVFAIVPKMTLQLTLTMWASPGIASDTSYIDSAPQKTYNLIAISLLDTETTHSLISRMFQKGTIIWQNVSGFGFGKYFVYFYDFTIKL